MFPKLKSSPATSQIFPFFAAPCFISICSIYWIFRHFLMYNSTQNYISISSWSSQLYSFCLPLCKVNSVKLHIFYHKLFVIFYFPIPPNRDQSVPWDSAVSFPCSTVFHQYLQYLLNLTNSHFHRSTQILPCYLYRFIYILAFFFLCCTWILLKNLFKS